MKCREAEEKLRHLEMTNGQVKDRKKAFQFSSQNLTRGFPQQELEAKCKAAEEKLTQYEKMKKDYQVLNQTVPPGNQGLQNMHCSQNS